MPEYKLDELALGQLISALGKSLFDGIRGYAEQHNIEIEGLPKDPKAEIPPEQALQVLQNFAATLFPRLAPAAPSPGAPSTA